MAYHPPQCSVLADAGLSDLSHRCGWGVASHRGFDLHFRVTDNVRHLLLGLSTICTSPVEKVLFRSFARFLICVVFCG